MTVHDDDDDDNVTRLNFTSLILDLQVFNLLKCKNRYITVGFELDFINKPNVFMNNFETTETVRLIGGGFF